MRFIVALLALLASDPAMAQHQTFRDANGRTLGRRRWLNGASGTQRPGVEPGKGGGVDYGTHTPPENLAKKMNYNSGMCLLSHLFQGGYLLHSLDVGV